GAGTRAQADMAQPGPDQLVHKGPHVVVGDVLVGDGLRVHGPSAPRAASTGRSFRHDSAYSLSGSESATMPQPAYSQASSPSNRPDRKATANSPWPWLSTQPLGPAYQPRGAASRRRMRARALSVGWPPMAGVGCTRAASSNTVTPVAARARTGVYRCCTLANFSSAGAAGASRSVHRGARAARIASSTT